MNAGAKAAARRRAERAGRRNKSRKTRRLALQRSAGVKHWKPIRTAAPLQYKGVTRFSENAGKYGPVEVVRLAKSSGLLDELVARTTYDWGGRSRIPGDWALAYLAFVNSKSPDIQPWWKESDAMMWWEAGFERRPGYFTVLRRFEELEELALEDFFAASATLVKLAIEKSGERVAFDLVVDCTEAETNARLHHDCREGEGCSGPLKFVTNRHGREIAKNNRVVASASTAEAKAHRERVNAEPFPDDLDQARSLPGDVDEITYDDQGDGIRVKVNGHWYRLRDPDAGVRAYTRGNTKLKFWAGYYNLKATCVNFGAPILSLVEAADEQEWNLFDEVIARTEIICGKKHVRAVLTDRGFAVKPVFQQCTERGITLVAPLRAEKGDDDAPKDRDEFDRDGIPRCKHCGGPTEFVRFAAKPNPRIWYRCARPYKMDEAGEPTDRCEKDQSISCSHDWRYLLPLWRNTDAYQALFNLSFAFERAHHIARRRTNTAGKDEATRPRRIGRACQQLRSHAAVILDWLKIGDRMGYLPGSVFSLTGREDIQWAISGKSFDERMDAERRAEGLNRPYGPAAVKLDIGPLVPRRRQIRDADRDLIVAGNLIDRETGEIIDEHLDTSRDLGDIRWGSDPPDKPPSDPPDTGELPF